MTGDQYEIVQEWEEPEELSELLLAVRERRPDANLHKIRYAFYLAEHAHAGQARQSGEAYITHPLAVAMILAGLGMDDDSIVAALLHDVVEDTSLSAQKLEESFGIEVANLVEGVTKLKLKLPSEADSRQKAIAETTRAAESLRKMLLAMARDIRGIIIKLADRLHNMQTLDALSTSKQIRIAQETLDIYAPLAARLGIWQMKWQLEDLAFKYLHPTEFQNISEMVGRARADREKMISEMVIQVKEGLESRDLKGFEIQGRPKHLYSIYNKMVKQQLPFEEIFDLLALRIIVHDKVECYTALMIVHELWPAIPGMFFDYIGTPKPNGYRSIHTKIYGPHREPVEIQIRTREMHRVAEFGVAAHWTYKEGTTNSTETDRISQMRNQLFDWSGDNVVSSDFLRTVSTDLFSEQVFVLTPKGDVLDLPKDSSPVDFAFRVHTGLGLTTVGAKVNGIMVPLNSRLRNGDVVELITKPNAQPSMDWLEFVKSGHARNKLRTHFRRLTRNDDILKGRESLERDLKAAKLPPREWLSEAKLEPLVEQFDGIDNVTDLLAKVGSGLISTQRIINKLKGTVHEVDLDRIQTTQSREGKAVLAIGGVEDIVIRRAKCCDPIPGDELVGYVTRGRGIMVHRKVCPNAMRFQLDEPERLMRLDWPAGTDSYMVTLEIQTVNRQGLLMDISTIFGESNTNVSSAKVRTLPNHTAEIEVGIDVRDTEHLQFVMNKISNYTDVISIRRKFSRTASR